MLVLDLLSSLGKGRLGMLSLDLVVTSTVVTDPDPNLQVKPDPDLINLEIGSDVDIGQNLQLSIFLLRQNCYKSQK